MEERVNRWPIIVLITASVIGLAAFSALQSQQSKAKQQAEYDRAEKEHAQIEAVMKAIGEHAAHNAIVQQGPKSEELAAMEAEDWKWLRDHPRSPTLPRSADH